MREIHPLVFVNAARNAIMACDVIGWAPPHGWQVSMDSLRDVWRTYGDLYFNLALYQLREEGRIRIVEVDRVYLLDACPLD
ncbi:hypothetical protein [Dyella sp. ASV21]|uniref:hypothetical protein n=1 Tax=Dyella sp. ASV21 TaxID=2795114 RepID=UPI0018EE3272|nr:hypothetical protein [Dyella sp. ASV21]